MRAKTHIVASLALLLFLLCSCMAGSDNTTINASSTRTTRDLSTPTMNASSVAAPMSTINQSAPAPFAVTSIDVSVSPATLSTWTCASYIQAVYFVTFHVTSGPSGGVINFSYTLNNGRSQTLESLTTLAGQRLSSFVFVWQGALPSDHTYPGLGGVMVTSPNQITSRMVAPVGMCR